ncbi:fungal specific transcription factor domain-containing protein [Paraphaeosphaeria sporulosa]
MAFQQPHVPLARPGKLPIPRLDRPREPPAKPAAPRQARVSRACLSCRARKIKCNGAQPKCQNCADNQGDCVYAASRKDRLKTATEHNQDLLHLLQELRPGASPREKQKIDDILAAAAEDVAEVALTLQKSPDKTLGDSPNVGLEYQAQTDDLDEANVTAEVGSNEDIDNMGEDLLSSKHSRAIGYIGKNSEVQWLRRLHREADGTSSGHHDHGPYGPPGSSAQAHEQRIAAMHQRQNKNPLPLMDTRSCSFYLDEEPLDMDMEVDPLELPPYETAEHLLKCYMQTVQNSFPILSQKTFTKQFVHYYSLVAQGAPYKLPQKWQAMLNLVFAIGAVYSHLMESDHAADERDHLLYHKRAWLTHPDLAQMQITGLLSFYYMAIGHVNRSWVVIGMSIRFGFSLGLHIRNEDRTATAVKKELLSRIWWAVYSLDRTLSAVTGRPSVGADVHSSTTLPLPISANDIDEAIIQAKFGTRPKWGSATAGSPSDAGSSRAPSATPLGGNPSGTDARDTLNDEANAGTFLIAVVKLGMVSNNVLNQLYSPNLVTKSWKDIQGYISQLADDLDAWLYSLPAGLDPFKDHGRGQTMQQERNILKTYYYSTKILICRPCLCRLDRRIRSQTQSSVNFNHQTAAQCVAAAKSIAACLPDDMAVWGKEIYKIFPWWSAVHYLMQSIAILLLEACYEAESSAVLPAVKKLVRWLRELSSTNRTAERAYSITVDLLKKLASRTFQDPRTTQEIKQLLSEHPSPTVSDVGYSGFATQWLTGEEFLEQHPSPQEMQPSGESYMSNVFAESMPTVNVFPGATDLPVSGFFSEALHSHSPLANVFLTGFDQHNPLPFNVGDVYMPDAPGQAPHGQRSTWDEYQER